MLIILYFPIYFTKLRPKPAKPYTHEKKQSLLFWILLLLSITPTILNAEVIDLKTMLPAAPTTSVIPTRTVDYDIYDGYRSIIVKYTFPVATLKEDPMFSNRYFWEIYGFNQSAEEGFPSVPERVDAFAVPIYEPTSVSIIDTTFVEYNCTLAPARIHQTDNDDPLRKEQIKLYNDQCPIYPNMNVSRFDTQIYKNEKIAYIKVCPISYNPNTATVRAMTSLTYRVRIGRNLIFKTQDRENELRSISSSTNSPIINNTVINVSATASDSVGPYPYEYIANPQTFVILSVPKYESAALRLKEWKSMLGFTTLLEIRDTWTTESVREFVEETYYEVPNFDYIVLLGGVNDIPTNQTKIIQFSKDYLYTDQIYVCMDGEDDYLPDIMLGRIPVNHVEEADNVIDKIIAYEKTPTTYEPFYKTITGAAQFQPTYYNYTREERRFASTMEEIRNYTRRQLLDAPTASLRIPFNFERIYFADPHVTPEFWKDGNPVPDELRKPTYSWSGCSDDIINAINQGTFLIMHRDHGDSTCLHRPYFGLGNLNKLNNQGMYPILFSINCLTGAFHKKLCLTRELLTLKEKGMSSIIAASDISYTNQNDAMISGMIDAIWPNPGLRNKFNPGGTNNQPIYTLGAILQQGQQRMIENNGGNIPLQRYQNYIYHVLGDPSLSIPTGVPVRPKNYSVNRNEDHITVSCPFRHICVGFYNRKTGEGSKYHGFNIKYYTSSFSDIVITIYDHNLAPITILPEFIPPGGVLHSIYSIRSIWPNPSSDIANIELDGEYSGNENILFSNTSTGTQYIVPIDPEQKTQQVDISSFAKGSYLVNIISPDGTSLGKQCIINR